MPQAGNRVMGKRSRKQASKLPAFPPRCKQGLLGSTLARSLRTDLHGVCNRSFKKMFFFELSTTICWIQTRVVFLNFPRQSAASRPPNSLIEIVYY